ncbi:MAG: hypothetical protein Q8P13_03965 [bacterium]|nr:hypothetical protein [bacterium]
MKNLFETEEKIFTGFLTLKGTAWECLTSLETYIDSLFENPPEGLNLQNNLLLGENVKLGNNVVVLGKAILCAGTEVCDNAVLRDGVILGQNSFIGFGIEIKHCVIMSRTRIPHLNYVADSIIGNGCNFGAGVITANWKGGFANKEIAVSLDEERFDTGLEKFGALVGDGVYLGCNAVLDPGAVIGKGSLIYPLSLIRGEVPVKTIVKNHQNLEMVAKAE